MVEIKKILVPIDFSDFSIRALKYGVALARHFGAKICLLHVISQELLNEIKTVRGFLGEDDSPGEFLERKKRDINEKIEKIVNGETDQALFEGQLIEVGIPAEEIIRVAKERKVDLVVIATRGRSGLSHILMGSVAEKVVRRSPCPVLSVRGKEF
ncbi:MAG: universal stress protein [Desulfobacterales bacterium]|nr:universal stress protein [Desulfobacterales bacterium]